MCLLLILSVSASSQEAFSPLGIFDATADWGMPESPPRRGDKKIPGRVEVVGTGADAIYNLLGNGDEIWELSDEGFYVYKELEGSWQISGRIEWVTAEASHAKAGFMIREDPESSQSKNYFGFYRYGNSGNVTAIREQLRKNEGDITTPPYHLTMEFPVPSRAPYYIRVTRVEPEHTFFTEYSEDGKVWEFLRQSEKIPMGHQAAYGIAINSDHEDFLAQARFSDVTIAPALYATRDLPDVLPASGSPVDVTLTLHNTGGTPVNTQTQEALPPGWRFLQSEPAGQIDGATLTWEMNLPPGETRIVYQAVYNENASYYSLFTGKASNLPILGDRYSTRSLGVFDDVADWGADPFPYRRGRYKQAGKVFVTESSQGLQYDIYGNGDDVANDIDEGFYLYSERTGSWSISAHLKCIDIGRDHIGYPHVYASLMLRENPQQVNSKNFHIYVRAPHSGPEGGSIAYSYRASENGDTPILPILPAPDKEIVDHGEGIYLRLTRLAPQNYILAEWSKDGRVWHFAQGMTLDLGESAAYGISLANCYDNEQLAHFQASHVELTPPLPQAWRRIVPGQVVAGAMANVKLELYNYSNDIQTVDLIESIPEGSRMENPSHNGMLQKGVLNWHLSLPPGLTEVTYVLQFPENQTEGITLSGALDGRRILGEERLSLVSSPEQGLYSNFWRFWTEKDGLYKSNIDWLAYTESGNIIAQNFIQEEISLYDGYNIVNLPSPGHHLEVIQSPEGETWSLKWGNSGLVGLQRLEGRIWQEYALPGILDSTRIIDDCLLSNGKNKIIIVTPVYLYEFDALTKTIRTLKDIHSTGLGEFNAAIPSLDGEAWVTGDNGVAKVIRKQGRIELDSKWIEYLAEPEDLNIFYLLRKDLLGDLYALSGPWKPEKKLIRFDGRSFQVLKRSPNHILGMARMDGSIWYRDFQSHTLKMINRDQLEITQNEGILSSNVRWLYNDNRDGIWAATDLGMARNAYHSWNAPPEMDQERGMVFDILEDASGRLWFLFRDKLISQVGDRFLSFPLPTEHSNSLSLSWRPQLYETPFGDILIAGAPTERNPLESRTSNILLFKPKDKIWELPPIAEYIIGVANEKGGSLLLRTSRQEMIRWDREGFHSVARVGDRRSGWMPLSMHSTSQGGWLLPDYRNGESPDSLLVFLSNQMQIYRAHDLKKPPVQHSLSKLFPDQQVKSIADIGDSLWIGTQHSLYTFKVDRWIAELTGLQQVNEIYGGKNGDIWVGTSDGLYRYTQGSWIRIGREEGIPSPVVTSILEDREGKIWIGTTQGLRRFYPEFDPDAPIAMLDQQEEEYQKSFAEGGRVRIAFQGRDKWSYTEAENLLFSTRLDDDDWSVFTGENFYETVKIPAGEHTLQIRAMDRNGNVSAQPVSHSFTILRPWYREPSFLVVSTIGSLLTLFFAILSLRHYIQLRTTFFQLKQANRQLNVANAQLLELDKMKSAFVSQASHDLRTPLTAIKGSLENLHMGIAGDLSDKQKKVVERASKSVDRLTGLVNDVLDLSRIESGRMVLEKSPVALSTLVEAVIQECRPAAEQKRIALNYTTPSEPATLPLDGGKMQRVIGELVSNAIKYTPEGGRVDISLTSSDGQVSLSVKDTGIGMSSEDRQKIWERFYRTPQSQKMAKGSGLGLSIAKELVEMHGGTLAAVSEEGKGTVFVLALPMQAIG